MGVLNGSPAPVWMRTGETRRQGLPCLDGETGAIAQLGERFNGIEEVSGSIPLGSTKNPIKSNGYKAVCWIGVSNKKL